MAGLLGQLAAGPFGLIQVFARHGIPKLPFQVFGAGRLVSERFGDGLEIVRNQIGANGAPYVSNRTKATSNREPRRKAAGLHQGLAEALASLGLSATPAQGDEATGQLPEGGAGMEEPEIMRQLPPMQRPRAGGRGYLGLSGRDHPGSRARPLRGSGAIPIGRP
jgi:hypothetical protein